MREKMIGLKEGKNILAGLKEVDSEIYYGCLGKLLPRHRAIVNLFLEGKTSRVVGISWGVSGPRAVQIFSRAVSRIQRLFLYEKHLVQHETIIGPEIKTQEALNLSVECLDVCVRTRNCLKVMVGGAPIQLRDLVAHTEVDLLEIQHFGKRSLEELKIVLQNLGLSLGMRI